MSGGGRGSSLGSVVEWFSHFVAFLIEFSVTHFEEY